MDGLLLAVALLSWCLCGVLLTVVGCLALKTLSRLPGDGYNWRAGPDADKRGEELLREVLAEGEFQLLQERGYLDVPSPHTEGRIYRIPLDDGLVHVYEGGELTHRLCLQPVEYLPRYDVIVMHKLMINADEHEYLERANAFPPLFHSW
jgi:hypothetical protein